MIHGSKKVKKQKTQQQIKQQQQLSNKINAKLADFFIIRKEQFTDAHIPKYMEFTALLMQLCSDIPTIFNFRRQLLQKVLKINENDLVKKGQYLTNEIKLVTKLIQQDPKSYTLWSFRQWLVQNLFKINNLIVKEQKKLCKLLLIKDQKNFHVWNYRNWVNSIQLDVDQQLSFTQQKIKANPFNFSPYHFRSKYLPLKSQKLLSSNQTSEQIKKQIIIYGMSKQSFNSELESINTAIYLNPNQQAPWIYYRWLLKRLIPVFILKQVKQNNLIKIYLNQRVYNLQKHLEGEIQILNFQKLTNIWSININNELKLKNKQLNSNDLIKTQSISKYFLGNIQEQNKSILQEIKQIMKKQQLFIRQIVQEQQNCRFAWLELLQILKNKLYLTCSKQQWDNTVSEGQKILQKIIYLQKTNHYIQHLKQYWNRISNLQSLTEQQKYLIK